MTAAQCAPFDGAFASTVSVVIPTRDRPERVTTLVERVLAEPDLTEVVVVTATDDPSVTPIRAIDDSRLVLVVLPDRPTAARARLAGAQRAQGDLLVLLDDDVLPEPGFVTKHVGYHARVGNCAVAGAMPVRLPAYRAPGQATVRLYAEEWQRNWEEHHDNPLRALWLGHLSLPRSVFLAVEEAAMDEWSDAYHEDTDLGLRLERAGLVGVAADDIRAEHLQQRDLAGVLRDADRQARGVVQLAAAHPAHHGALPSYLFTPGWLYRLSRLLAARPVGALAMRSGAAAATAAGRLGLWTLETSIVRLLRRLAAMVAIRRALTHDRTAARPGGAADQ